MVLFVKLYCVSYQSDLSDLQIGIVAAFLS
jgi:hypothetical protein